MRRTSQPLHLALLEEVVLLLAFIGLGTVTWLAEGDEVSWWKGAVPEIAIAYVVRFAVEIWLRYRGKPLLRLMYEESA